MTRGLKLETSIGDFVVSTEAFGGDETKSQSCGFETKIFWLVAEDLSSLSFRHRDESEARKQHAKVVRRLKKSLQE